MKDLFINTKNVRKFENGVKAANHKLIGVERMVLVTGEAGLGKTKAAIHHCAQNGAILVRTLELMRGPWLLRAVVKELGAEPKRQISDVFDQIIDLQKDKMRTIVFDEVDRFADKTEILETIRDIHDVCHCPIVFIGEELVDKKLMKYRRLYRRFIEVVRFERMDLEDLRNMINQVADVKFEPAAISRLATETNGKISDVINVIHRAEGIARSGRQDIVGEKDIWKN
jgi:DNA transposition AAA+ family ATPase